MNPSLVGSRLGKYEIQAEIGKGGMGVVYQGYDALLDRRVAVKVLAPHLVWEPGFVERFLREARSAARLKHASIVTIYDVGQQGDWYYIVMEYLEGPTLAQIIAQQGPSSSRRVLPVLRQVADALDYAHGCGLIHRDVKPGNIVLDPAGRATLTDFGVARAAQETRLTTTGALVGTPQYMSPEQAQGEDLDHRTDLYSLAVVAYEMLTGRAPFGATTPHAVLHQLIYDPPPPVRSLRPDLPLGVEQVLARALSKEPAARFGTAATFVDALAQVLADKARPVPQEQGVAAAGPSLPSAPARTRKAPSSPLPSATSREWKAARPVPAATPAGWTLWFLWFLASTGGWVVGWLAGRPVAGFVGWSVGANLGLPAAEIASGAAHWAVTGLLVGLLQGLVLWRFARRSGWWVLATPLAYAAVGSFRWGQGLVMEPILSGTFFWLERMGWAAIVPVIGPALGMVPGGLVGLIIGFAQWLVLRGWVRRAGRWVWINVLAWALEALAIAALVWAWGEPVGDEVGWLFGMVSGIVPGVVTTTGLVWLLAKGRRAKGRS